ncbi:MAG: hypothetical protein HPY53_06400 [Brevinematales bacterium]|nr:hypothetical protein [Brevinematales bacterium]
MTLSRRGELLLQTTLKSIEEELEKFSRIRTKAYYPAAGESGVRTIEYRDIVDKLVVSFDLKDPHSDRRNEYSTYIYDLGMKILHLKTQIESPYTYIIAEQTGDNGLRLFVNDMNLKISIVKNYVYRDKKLVYINDGN